MTSRIARRLAGALTLLVVGTACEKDLTDLEPADFPSSAAVFLDGFGPGVSYDAFLGSKVDALSIDDEVFYDGTASLRFDIPDPQDPSGGFVGGTFSGGAGRDLSGYNALTFWARSSRTVDLDLVGFGLDGDGNNTFQTGVPNIRLTASWKQYFIPLPLASELTQEGGLFFLSEANQVGDPYSIWIDEVFFADVPGVGSPNAEVFTRLVSMAVGDQVQADVEVTVPVGGEIITVRPSLEFFTWSSSDPAVATVSSSGLITKVASGEAQITASLGSTAVPGSVSVQDGVGLAGVVFDDAFGAGVFFDTFGDGADPNAVAVTEQEAFLGSRALAISIPGPGSFAGGVFKTNELRDLSNSNALVFYAKAANPTPLDVAGFGNDNTGTSQFIAQRSGLSITTDWQRFVVPIPDPARLTAEGGLFTFAQGGPPNTIFLDEIAFLDLDELGAPVAAIVGGTETLAVGGTTQVEIASLSFPVGTETVAVDGAIRYYTFASSDESVATVSETGLVTMVAEGSADITATLGGTAVAGTLTVETAGGGGGPTAPTVAAPTPTQAAGDVISIYSDAYDDVPVNRLASGFDGSTTVFSEETVAGNATLLYSNLNFEVAEFTGANSIDASGMTNFRMDIWTPDATRFSLKLVDFGADNGFGGGDDSESTLFNYNAGSTPPLAQGEWISLDIPLADFTAAGLASLANLSQLVIEGAENGPDVYVDNIYFYDAGGSGGGGGPFDGGEIVNGSFETGDLTNWVTTGPGAATVVGTDGNSGTSSAQLQVGTGQNIFLQQNSVAAGTVADGDQIDISFFIKGTLEAGAVLQTSASWEAGTTNLITPDGSAAPLIDNTSASDWTEYTFSATLTGGNLANGFSLQLQLVCGGAAGCNGDILIDDISLTVTPAGGGGGGGTFDGGEISNGSFETGDLTNWGDPAPGAGTVTVVDTDSNSGTFSARAQVGQGQNVILQQGGIAAGTVADGDQVDISFFLRGTLADGAELQTSLAWQEGTTSLITPTGSATPSILASVADWTEFTFSTTVTGGVLTNGFILQLNLVCGGAGTCDGDILIDDVSLTVTSGGGGGGGGGGGAGSISLPITFDDGGVTNADFIDFEGGGPTTLVADPTDAGNTVAQTVKSASAGQFAGVTFTGANGLDAPIPFTASNTTMTVRVYSPDAGIEVRLKVEDQNDPTRSVETGATTTVANGWETLTFNFSNQTTGTAALNLAFDYAKASIFFNIGTDGAAAGAKTYFWDDVTFVN
jgi:hypothetical protein